jgi:hypothetical protein
LFQVIFRRNHDINTVTKTDKIPIDLACRLSAGGMIGDNDEDSDIALRPHVTSGCRAKEDDALWVDNLNDPSY